MLSLWTKRRNTSGFTLVELLTVISIIAILIGVLSAGLVAARHHAMQARAQTQLRELVKAWTQFYATYSVFPLTGSYIAMTPANLSFLLNQDTTYNTRGIAFLNIKLDDSSDSGQNYLDPWGHPFLISFTKSTVSDTIARQISVAFPNRDRYKY